MRAKEFRLSAGDKVRFKNDRISQRLLEILWRPVSRRATGPYRQMDMIRSVEHTLFFDRWRNIIHNCVRRR